MVGGVDAVILMGCGRVVLGGCWLALGGGAVLCKGVFGRLRHMRNNLNILS